MQTKRDPNTYPTIYRGGKSVQINRLRHRHLAIMDRMLASPTIKMGELATEFNVTGPWLSTVVNSDLFQARLAERRGLMEAEQRQRITQKLVDVAESSIDAMSAIVKDDEVCPNTKHNIAKTTLEAIGILGKAGGGTQVSIDARPQMVSPAILEQSRQRLQQSVGATLEHQED